MYLKCCILLCVLIITGKIEAFARRDVSATTPNILESFQKNMELFKNCLDQSLARAVDDVNVKQVQPVFSIVGDQLNRFSKAFEDLTATKNPNKDF